MNTTKIIRHFVVGTLAACGIAAAGPGSGVAHATMHNWCPGQPLPNPAVNWEMNLCHDYDTDEFGNVESVAVYSPPGVAPTPSGPTNPDYCVVNPVGCHFFGPYGPGSHN